MDARHQHVFGAIATKLDMEDSAVEEFMLEGAQVSCSVQAPHLIIIYFIQIQEMDNFFAANGPKGLIFYYEEIPQTSADGMLNFAVKVTRHNCCNL